MFYFFSKIFLFLLRPIIWVVILLLLGIFLPAAKWRKRPLWAAVATIFLMGNAGIQQQVLRWWEVQPAQLSGGNYTTAIVLGGYLSEEGRVPTDFPELSDRADRLLHALALVEQGEVESLILTGGAGGFVPDEEPEARSARDYGLQLGLPAEAFLIEDQSRNTVENARLTAELVRKKGMEGPFLLVTSAWHMPRAKACFDKAGLEVTPYPVDYLQSRLALPIGGWFMPQTTTFLTWEILLKEWVGLLVYRAKGYA